MSAYVITMSSRTSDTPHSAIAFMEDEIEVVNLDVNQIGLTDEMRDVFDTRLDMFLEDDVAPAGSDVAYELMKFCLSNSSAPTTEPVEYETDEEAFKAAYELF